MNKFILSTIFLLLFFISSNSAEACSPPVDWDRRTGDSFFGYKTTFAGTVKKVNADVSEYKLEITFDVDVIFNGDIPNTEVIVVTGLGSSLCSYEIGDFKKGDIWIIYSDYSGATLTIDNFSGSQKFESYEQVFDYEREYFPRMVGCGVSPDGKTYLGSCYVYNRFENSTNQERDNDDIDIVEPVFCTADAMQCSDGSWVSRTGSNCEFICPKVKQEILDEPISYQQYGDKNKISEESVDQPTEETKSKNLFIMFWDWLTNLF